MTKIELIIFKLEDIKSLLEDGEARCAIEKLNEIENPSFDIGDVAELLQDGEYRIVIEYIDEMISKMSLM